MRTICIINQKGGVGKTTTVASLSVGLARKGRKVLILDLDSQGNLSTYLCAHSDKNMYHLLINKENPNNCIVNIAENLDIIPSNKELAQAEISLSGIPSRETVLKRALEPVKGYDYILVDCPPSLSLLSQNALAFCKEAFVPVATEYLALDGLKKISANIDEMNELFKHKLKISAIIPTMYDKRIKSCIKTLAEIRRGYNGIVLPPIRTNSKLKEAPGLGTSIYDYAKYSRGAKDYQKLVDAVIDQEFYYN
ncbi:MAG: AAA family ATPase [Candidatus Woesearchaeota archaeon]